jgi:hypothetical protein
MLGLTSNPNGWYGIVVALGGITWQAINAFLDRRRKVVIRQNGDSITNCAWDLTDGRVVYFVRVSITNDSPRRPAVIRGYELQPPWKDDELDLWPDPDDGIPSETEYVIKPPFLRYPRHMVLNHRVDNQGKLGVGDNISGMLIFRGAEPIPVDLESGAHVTATLKVYLQDGKSFSTPCYLRIDAVDSRRCALPSGTDLLVIGQ